MKNSLSQKTAVHCGCFAASVANSIPSLSFENQKSPDIVKCLLRRNHQPRSTGLCEDRLYLQIPVILKFNASDCGFYPCAVAVSIYYSLENKKQHRKPAHHKIISRTGLQSRAFVLISLEKNLHMKIFSNLGLNTLSHIPCLQTCLQIPIWKGIKRKTTIFFQTHCSF